MERPSGSGLRDRFRAQVREETKQLALRQLAEGGPEALSLNAIAKRLGVSGPALYRYFANRDSLLTELIIDAYDDLGAALEAADVPVDRLRSLVRAYRGWAVAEPHRYRLLFRAPLPGYDAHAERLVEASQRAMNVALDVVGQDQSKAVALWAWLHGLVSLEIDGNFASMGFDPAPLYEAVPFA